MKINLINIFINTYNETYNKNIKYIHNLKYTTAYYINELLNFTRNSVYWSRYSGKINGKTLNNKHNEFIKLGIYDKVYQKVLNIYYKQYKFLKLKYLSVDSLFIKNKLCIMKPNLNVNKKIEEDVVYIKIKGGLGISTIIDSYGIPISYSTQYVL